MELADVRNIREAGIDLDSGLNVFVGANAQGKTSLLEAVGLLARGRSFRTEDVSALIRQGAPRLWARAVAVHEGRETRLEVEIQGSGRRLRVDGQDATPRHYHGRLEVAVYSTDRLKVVRGPMRERRLYLDRNASALWPAYRQLVREYERVVTQRNAALEAGSRDIEAWDERLVCVGAELRRRRNTYAGRLQQALERGYRPGGESYGVSVGDGAARTEGEEQARLAAEVAARHRDERRARRSLVGPHRDPVQLTVDGEEASLRASSGQARSLLLALTLASLEVYREERGEPAVALLDDVDSELDEARSHALCQEVAARGQTLVTTAHPGWVQPLRDRVRAFQVDAGRVRALGST